MVILSSPVTATHDGVSLAPFARYVVTISQGDAIIDALRSNDLKPVEASNFNSYERRYSGHDLNAKTLCIYRHAAFGDQLMTTAIPAYLKTRWPKAHVIMSCGIGVSEVWENNPDVDFCSGAVPFETAKLSDYHLFFESMLECNGLEEQGNAYDDMFAFGGMLDVPNEFKRPHIYIGTTDIKRDSEWRNYIGKEPYIVYQWNAGNPVRQYPPDMAAKLLEQWVDTKIVVVGKTKDKIPSLSHVVDLTNRTNHFRQLIPIIRQSKAVVCPDSSISHLCAAFPGEVKAISLWGPFSPDDRILYYENHTALQGRCPHAPCRTHSFKPPIDKCRDAGAEYVRADNCAALATITTHEIVSAIKNIL